MVSVFNVVKSQARLLKLPLRKRIDWFVHPRVPPSDPTISWMFFLVIATHRKFVVECSSKAAYKRLVGLKALPPLAVLSEGLVVVLVGWDGFQSSLD